MTTPLERLEKASSSQRIQSVLEAALGEGGGAGESAVLGTGAGSGCSARNAAEDAGGAEASRRPLVLGAGAYRTGGESKALGSSVGVVVSRAGTFESSSGTTRCRCSRPTVATRCSSCETARAGTCSETVFSATSERDVPRVGALPNPFGMKKMTSATCVQAMAVNATQGNQRERRARSNN
jgi:hypothetical protein